MSTLFIDESKTKGYTIVTVTVSANASAIRKEVAKLRKNGQSRVHMVKESDSRRRQILATLAELGLTARVYHAVELADAAARRGCLAAIVADACVHGVTRLVLERDDSIEKFDRNVLRQEIDRLGAHRDITFAHETAKQEPLLWVPDAIAWSYSRGGEWSTRIRPMLTAIAFVEGVD